MEFVTAEAQLLLAFVDGVSRHGHVPSVAEFDAFAAKPKRAKSNPLAKLVSGGAIANLVEGMQAAAHDETALRWLDRLGWLRIDRQVPEAIRKDDPVRITSLGRAVLAAAREGSREEELPTEVVLDQGDPIARARVIERLAGLGDFALVDRYFSADDFLGVLHRTGASRVLTGPNNSRGRLSGLREAVDSVTPPRPFELRIDRDDRIHDRYAIPESGAVVAIGTSLSGVGKRQSVMVELGDGPAAESIRATFEARWEQAEPVKPNRPEEEVAGDSSRQARSTESNGTERDNSAIEAP